MPERLLGHFYAPTARSRVLAAGFVVLCQLGIAWLVYATGGVKFAALHLMYLPIIVAALMCGTVGGLVAAVAGGVLLGPFMPLDSVTGEAQKLGNWLYRIVFFCMVGGVRTRADPGAGRRADRADPAGSPRAGAPQRLGHARAARAGGGAAARALPGR